jgi:FkbM family methyltransferase
MLNGPSSRPLTLCSMPRKSIPASRSARLALLEAAFTNWRVPGYLGSVAYRVRRVSPALFDRMMGVRLVLNTRRGPSLMARLRDVNGPAEVFGLDEYETPSLNWSKVDYVLDAGGHVGGFSLWAASRSKCRILALEPNPSTRALFETNVKRSQLGDRVQVRPWALAASSGKRRLRPASDSAATALVDGSKRGDIEVDAVTLADAIASSGFPRIDLLKMDIEGAEHEVFDSIDATTLRLVDFCIVERHPSAEKGRKSIAQVLSSAGFDVTEVAKPLDQALLIARRQERC